MVITREIREEIESAVNNAVNRCIKNETFISEIANKVTKAIEKTMEQTLRKFEEAVAEIEKRHINRISNVEDMIDKIKQEKLELEEIVDRLDQNSRQCHLRVFGLKEKPNENVAEELKHVFKANMLIDLKDDDIKLCYRVGSRETGKIRNRCVFLKLNNLNTKENVYGKKKFLKGTGIAVREDLTRNRVKLLNGAMEKVGFNNVWTVNGKIYVNKDVIKEPTRVTKNSATLLDFILISDNISISKIGSVPCYHISDHELVYVDNTKSKHSCYCYRNGRSKSPNMSCGQKGISGSHIVFWSTALNV
nr:unnamed protein product [Callosobruchus analis]